MQAIDKGQVDTPKSTSQPERIYGQTTWAYVHLIALTCLSVPLLIIAHLGLGQSSETYLVFLDPPLPAAQVLVSLAENGGSLLGFGGFDQSYIVHSTDPNFAHAAQKLNAKLILPLDVNIGCGALLGTNGSDQNNV